jgi:hypothetical protein
MKQTKIDLLEPFEKVLGAVLSAPENHKVIGGRTTTTGVMFAKRGNQGRAGSAEIRGLLRCIYEAAHGRQVETQIGHVAIAPPVAASLKETPFYVKTQVDFLLEALTRIIRGASRSNSGIRLSHPPIKDPSKAMRATMRPTLKAKTTTPRSTFSRTGFFALNDQHFSSNQVSDNS